MVRQKPTSHLFAFHFHEHERKSLCHVENTWLNLLWETEATGVMWCDEKCDERFAVEPKIIINWKCFHSFTIQMKYEKVSTRTSKRGCTVMTKMKGTNDTAQIIPYNWNGIIIVKKKASICQMENTLGEFVYGNLFTIRTHTLNNGATLTTCETRKSLKHKEILFDQTNNEWIGRPLFFLLFFFFCRSAISIKLISFVPFNGKH